MSTPRMDPARERHYAGVRDHEALARVLSDEQREWLTRMADVLPPGWVIQGMAVPPRGGVVPDGSYPGGRRLVVAPAGPGSASMGWRPKPHGEADFRVIAPQVKVPAPPPRPSPTRAVRR